MEALGLDVLFMGSNAARLLQGLWVAVQISAISVVLSIILGMLFGIFMTWKNPVAKVISRLYLEIVRIMPQLVLLYIVFFGATRVMGLNISAELSSIIVFVFWGTGEMGDLVRGALTCSRRSDWFCQCGYGCGGHCGHDGCRNDDRVAFCLVPQAVFALAPKGYMLFH